MTLARPSALAFTGVIGLGSLLLFLVQPMIARAALPALGGAPNVWNTAMVFYQATLLAGYAYAHALQRWRPGRQALVHLGLWATALLTLPVGLRLAPGAAVTDPAGALLVALLLGVGPAFFLVSAQAPLLQAWFARGGGGDPYRLYAASNLGSLVGLVAYPFLLDPLTGLGAQRLGWSAAFAMVGLGTGGLALAMRRQMAVEGAAQTPAPPPPRRAQMLRWLLLAAVPSGLMLSTTTHLTTDIMAMPLLWVLPLSLYLLSFILVFGPGGAGHSARARALAAPALLVLGPPALFLSAGSPLLAGLVGLVLLLVVATALHGALAVDRPAPHHLTRFYLLLSAGGVLGGGFAGLLAPSLFDWVWEHPLLLLAAALLLPQRPLTVRLGRLWLGRGALARALRVGAPPLALLLSLWLGHALAIGRPAPAPLAGLAALGLIAALAIGRPIQFAFALAMLGLAVGGWRQIDVSATPGARTRSFFGVHAVVTHEGTRRLLHGTTLHGVQSLVPGMETEPMSYYGRRSGVGEALRAMAGSAASVGVVGLGAGSLACHARPGQRWTFFEIDPAVVAIATDPAQFSFLARCTPGVRIVLGDARLTLGAAPAGSLDLIVVDAFTSDAIPLHLLTAEALATYAGALAPGGAIVLHVSNRYLDLEPVVAATAASAGLAAVQLHHRPTAAEPGLSASHWVVLAPERAAIARLLAASPAPQRWTQPRPRPGLRPWTDSHASVLPVVHWPWARAVDEPAAPALTPPA